MNKFHQIFFRHSSKCCFTLRFDTFLYSLEFFQHLVTIVCLLMDTFTKRANFALKRRTKTQEVVTKYSNDSNCAAIEDRFGSGSPPIGLCRKFKGKRSGSGSYLLRKTNPLRKK